MSISEAIPTLSPVSISKPILTHFLTRTVMEADQSFDEDEDDEEEEEEEEDVKTSKKRPAASPASKSQVTFTSFEFFGSSKR